MDKLYDSTFLKYTEHSNPNKHKVEYWLLETRARDGELELMGTEFQFCKMQRILEMDSRDGCIRRMYLKPWNCPFKNSLHEKSYITCILSQQEKLEEKSKQLNSACFSFKGR
jgi:hypothetical protein